MAVLPSGFIVHYAFLISGILPVLILGPHGFSIPMLQTLEVFLALSLPKWYPMICERIPMKRLLKENGEFLVLWFSTLQ